MKYDMLDTHVFWQLAHNKHWSCSFALTWPSCFLIDAWQCIWCQWRWKLHPTTIISEQHKPNLTLTINALLNSRNCRVLKKWKQQIIVALALMPIFTTFPTCRFYLMGGGGGVSSSCLGTLFPCSISPPGPAMLVSWPPGTYTPHFSWR